MVSSGLDHLIVKCGIGKVFTWGWGESGQLGLGNFKSIQIPQQVRIDKVFRVIQVRAARTSSILLCEGKKILWFGSNGVLNKKNIPELI